MGPFVLITFFDSLWRARKAELLRVESGEQPSYCEESKEIHVNAPSYVLEPERGPAVIRVREGNISIGLMADGGREVGAAHVISDGQEGNKRENTGVKTSHKTKKDNNARSSVRRGGGEKH